MIDDGTAEDSVGLTAGGALICLNSFPIEGGNSFFTSISIAWGTPAFPDPSLDGLPYTAVLWDDPNGDGSPTDAVVVATADGVISDQGTDTFLISDITPTLLTTANFFVGFIINHAAGQFPAAFDETAPLPNRSWVSANGDINNLSDAQPIEVATGGALVGNWLIRADAGVPGLAVLSTDPAVGSIVSTPPTDFTVNVSEAVDSSTLEASDFTVNGIPADNFSYTDGETTILFTFTTSPVTVEGEQTMHIDDGAFISDPDGDPVHEFDGTFRWDATLLQVTSTVPAVGGAFSPPAPGDYTYDVNFNEEIDPTSVDTSDLTLTGNAGGTVTSVTVINGNLTAEFHVHFTFGGNVTADIPEGAITDQFGNPGAAFNGSYTVEGCPPSQYVITEGTDAIVPGDTDTGNHCDDCNTVVALPFNFQLYDQTFSSVQVSSNGRLDFIVPNEPGGFITNCLPAPPNIGPYDFTIFPVWQDQRTDLGLAGCASFPGGTCGVFTSVSGSAPNRIFNIEWRTVLFADNSATQNHEVRLYENDPNLKYEVIIGQLNNFPAPGQNWVSGVQGDSGAGFWTQDFCTGTPPTNVSRTYEIPPCGTPSPTPPVSPTPTPPVSPTPTPSATVTVTPSVTPSVTPTPTAPPGHSPTPRPRPTPHPRPPIG
jgi:hypothetical protein